MPLTKEQNEIREKMCEMKVINNDLKKILKESCCELKYMIKFLDRLEPAICSLDGNKQLRMNIISLVNQMEITHKKLNNLKYKLFMVLVQLMLQRRHFDKYYMLSLQLA